MRPLAVTKVTTQLPQPGVIRSVAEVDHVVRVMVRDEDARPVERAHAGLHEPDTDAGAGVDEEALVAEREQRGRAAASGSAAARRCRADSRHRADVSMGP